MQSVFKFLNWKLRLCPENFTASESHIVSNNVFNQYMELSVKCCSYNQSLMQSFIEQKWQARVDNQWLLNGLALKPKVSCDSLPFVRVNRDVETLSMSMFYQNNLLNSFLYRKFPNACDTPQCGCGEGEQTVFHILFYCKGALAQPSDSAKQLNNILNGLQYSGNFISEEIPDLCTIILNHSRDNEFLFLVTQRIQECIGYLKTHFTLPTTLYHWLLPIVFCQQLNCSIYFISVILSWSESLLALYTQRTNFTFKITSMLQFFHTVIFSLLLDSIVFDLFYVFNVMLLCSTRELNHST